MRTYLLLLVVPLVLAAQACGGGTLVASGGAGGKGSGGGGGNAGGSGGEGGAGPIATCELGKDPSTAGVCTDMACVNCGGEQACNPFGFATKWASMSECVARTALLCQKQVTAPHVKATLASFEACANDTANLACEPFMAGDLPASCTLAPGEVTDGGACGFDAQCASGVCLKDFAESACGVCTTAQAGTTCNGQGATCGPALFCYGGMCTPRGKIGDACTTTLECAASVCSQGKCVAPRAEGDACSSLPDNDCDPRHGLACDFEAHQCAKIPVAGGGGSCGQLNGPVNPVCSAGFTCIVHDSPPGHCEANPADGMQCTQMDPTASSLECEPPALCSPAGCAIADPASCM